MNMQANGFRAEFNTDRQLIIFRAGRHLDGITLKGFAEECQKYLKKNMEQEWSILLDLSQYPGPLQHIEQILWQHLEMLRPYMITKQAILINGTPVHFPDSLFSWVDLPVVSYFQSEDEAMAWLFGREVT